MSARIGVILGQVGTPRSLDRAEVRRYLKEFLSDDRIIDLPRWRWMPVLHGAVLPTRPKMVGHHFAEIWTEQGSPLLVLSEAQRAGIQQRLGERYRVELGMAYSEPSMARAVARLEEAGIRRIVVLPLFPQYSNSTTASVYDEVMFHALGRSRRKGLPVKKYSPTLRFIHPFHDDPAYIAVLAASVRRQLEAGPEPDRIILSYHGLPRRFDDEGDPYRSQCEETTRLLAEALGWTEGSYEMAYQSRFGRTEWIKPYLQPRLGELHAEGVERPAIISPGFTTDCLETLHELGVEGRELFADGGGDPAGYRAVACLNDEPAWLDYAAGLIARNADGW
ncbi:MAG: ferrochelatase [Micrococcales bacterium 73-13]|nr:MAG: ferrochelatase [Micrococcales bacterium 73-13]